MLLVSLSDSRAKYVALSNGKRPMTSKFESGAADMKSWSLLLQQHVGYDPSIELTVGLNVYLLALDLLSIVSM